MSFDIAKFRCFSSVLGCANRKHETSHHWTISQPWDSPAPLIHMGTTNRPLRLLRRPLIHRAFLDFAINDESHGGYGIPGVKRGSQFTPAKATSAKHHFWLGVPMTSYSLAAAEFPVDFEASSALRLSHFKGLSPVKGWAIGEFMKTKRWETWIIHQICFTMIYSFSCTNLVLRLSRIG